MTPWDGSPADQQRSTPASYFVGEAEVEVEVVELSVVLCFLCFVLCLLVVVVLPVVLLVSWAIAPLESTKASANAETVNFFITVFSP